MPQHSLTVGGQTYEVDFPYAPYDCQLTMMEKVLESLTTGRNALLESPTGTACAAIPPVVLFPRVTTRRRLRTPRSVGTRKRERFSSSREEDPLGAADKTTSSLVAPFAKRRYRQDALFAVRGARVARGARAPGRRHPARRKPARNRSVL